MGSNLKNLKIKIMPIDYKKYPKNWKTEIVPMVKERWNNKCAFCNLNNYAVGFRAGTMFITTCGNGHLDKAGMGMLSYQEAKKTAISLTENEDRKYIIIVLKVAHLDHDISNNDLLNLKPLCQKCHLNYDKLHHMKNSRITRNNKKGLQELFTN
jgi:hypothetical protein